MEENNSSSIGEYEGNDVKIDIDQNEFNLSNILIEDYKRKMLNIDTEERLKPASRCCIYRVPTNLRKVNKEAYTPQFVSIGPFHYGKSEFDDMEKQKVRYKEDFGKRFKITEEEWLGLVNFLKEKEKDIRDCYADTFHFKNDEFIIMILYDAIFIIELFLKFFEEKKGDFLLKNPSFRAGIRLDLLLLENQLPFFVLKELYELAIDNRTVELTSSFVTLTCKFFNVKPHTGEFEHFVDLRRKVLVKNLPLPQRGKIRDLPSAVKLHESGVTFKKIDDANLLNIKFQDQGFLPCFKKNELLIPHATIADETESLFRNMMALEQCHYPLHTHICNYIDLMDALINSEKDVDFLVEKGIISNFMGDHAAIAQMFNNLCLQITLGKSTCYKDTVQALKTHHGRWWNRTKATLMSVYFSNVWRGTGTVAAITLLVLTFLQTIYSIGL